MDRKYIVLICLFVGIIIGMAGNELIVPVSTTNDTPFYHGVRGRNQIALTINVDWGEEFIPGILKVLEEKGIEVTFFVTGYWSEKNKEILKLMAEKGHEIGNHGFTHEHPLSLSRDELIELIKKNEELIFQITGQRTSLFAPPYGEIDSRITSTASSIGYSTIMWSADTVDWQRPAKEVIVQRAVNKIEDGGIILMHPTEPSLLALEDIIEILTKKGYNFVKVSELIK